MLRPLADRIVVELQQEHATQSGVVFPAAKFDGHIESQRQYGHRGTVLAVGPGKTTKKGVKLPMSTKPGDVVRFGEFMFSQILGTKHLVMIQEADITCVES